MGGGRGGGAGRGGEEERRRGGPPSGVEVRVECEAAAVGEQRGERDQVGLVAVPVLRGGEEEGGASAARTAVGVDQAVQSAGGLQPARLGQCQ